MKYLAFDLEIVKSFPSGENWKQYRPLGISCASTMTSDDPKPTIWFNGQYGDEPLPGAMPTKDVKELVWYMVGLLEQGYHPLTWNGLQFDFDVLAEESTLRGECIDLADNSIDMMFQVLCELGYPLGLDTVAKGLGLSGKTEGMHGDLAPVMWAGTVEDRKKVLEYVGQDAITTMEVCMAALEHHHIRWTAKSGKIRYHVVPAWKTVRECLKIPLPNTSWMTNPLKRESFFWFDL